MNKLNKPLTDSEISKIGSEDFKLIETSIDRDPIDAKLKETRKQNLRLIYISIDEAITDKEREKTRKTELKLLNKINLILANKNIFKKLKQDLGKELSDRKLNITERIRLEEETKIGKPVTQQEYLTYNRKLFQTVRPTYDSTTSEEQKNLNIEHIKKEHAKQFDVDGKDIKIDDLLKHKVEIQSNGNVKYTPALNSNSDISSSESNSSSSEDKPKKSVKSTLHETSSSKDDNASQPKSIKLTSVKKTPNLKKPTNIFTRFFGKFGRNTTGGAYTLKKRKH